MPLSRGQRKSCWWTPPKSSRFGLWCKTTALWGLDWLTWCWSFWCVPVSAWPFYTPTKMGSKASMLSRHGPRGTTIIVSDVQVRFGCVKPKIWAQISFSHRLGAYDKLRMRSHAQLHTPTATSWPRDSLYYDRSTILFWLIFFFDHDKILTNWVSGKVVSHCTTTLGAKPGSPPFRAKTKTLNLALLRVT